MSQGTRSQVRQMEMEQQLSTLITMVQTVKEQQAGQQELCRGLKSDLQGLSASQHEQALGHGISLSDHAVANNLEQVLACTTSVRVERCYWPPIYNKLNIILYTEHTHRAHSPVWKGGGS